MIPLVLRGHVMHPRVLVVHGVWNPEFAVQCWPEEAGIPRGQGKPNEVDISCRGQLKGFCAQCAPCPQPDVSYQPFSCNLQWFSGPHLDDFNVLGNQCLRSSCVRLFVVVFMHRQDNGIPAKFRHLIDQEPHAVHPDQVGRGPMRVNDKHRAGHAFNFGKKWVTSYGPLRCDRPDTAVRI